MATTCFTVVVNDQTAERLGRMADTGLWGDMGQMLEGLLMASVRDAVEGGLIPLNPPRAAPLPGPEREGPAYDSGMDDEVAEAPPSRRWTVRPCHFCGATDHVGGDCPVLMARTYGATRNCAGCRFWSEMIAQSLGGGPMEAYCLAPIGSPLAAKFVTAHTTCTAWKSGHHGAVDEPSEDGYGAETMALYDAEEAGQ